MLGRMAKQLSFPIPNAAFRKTSIPPFAMGPYMALQYWPYRSTTHTAPLTLRVFCDAGKSRLLRKIATCQIQGFPFLGQLVLELLLPMKLHLWVGIRALRHFLFPLARNLTGMVFKLQSILASDDFVELFASICLRFIIILPTPISADDKLRWALSNPPAIHATRGEQGSALRVEAVELYRLVNSCIRSRRPHYPFRMTHS